MTGTSPNSLQETFFNQSGDAIEVTTPQGRLIHVNPAFEKITGYSAEEAIGKTAAELMRPIGADAAFYDEIFRTINAGNVWTGEMTARKKDGTLWIASTTISPLRDENGVIFQFAAFKRDITAQKKMEQDLKESQSRFQSFAEIASDWLWEKDADLRFTFVTPRLDQHDAIQQVDYIGKTILDIDPGRIHNAIWRKHLADLAAHRPFRNFCYPITMSDDQKIIVSISGKPIFDDRRQTSISLEIYG